MTAKVSFPVGRQRLSQSLPSATISSTRDIREQMAALIKNANAVIKSIADVSPEALIYALQPIYDESQELVPVASGRLKRSGFIEVRLSGSRAEGVVGYARSGSPEYAIWVHENLMMPHRPPTQAKFLEAPVSKYIGEVPVRYAEYVRTLLGL